MNGIVDDTDRALIEIEVSRTHRGPTSQVTAWIDTAFDGHLVFSSKLIRELKLESLVETEAILADGTRVTLETFVCYMEWFGRWQAMQVIANDGRFPLLGTGLLAGRQLFIDYQSKVLSLS
jgi:clan AA aspartic protease